MKRSFIVLAAGGFLVGLLLGIGIGRRGAERNPEPDKRMRQPFSAQRVPEGPTVAHEMQEEILSLRRRLRELERQDGAAANPDRARQHVDALYRDLMDARLHEDPKRWLRMLGRLAELDPSMAPHFIAKYR